MTINQDNREQKGQHYHVNDEKHYEKWIEYAEHITFLLFISKYYQYYVSKYEACNHYVSISVTLLSDPSFNPWETVIKEAHIYDKL